MTRAETLLQEVLKLPAKERADVVTEVLASLDEEPVEEAVEVERAWAVEIERRARRVLAGESTAVPWESVRRSLEERLPKR